MNSRRYTYADYAKWDDGKRWELLDGVPYMMAAPSQAHQEISVALTTLFANFLKGKPCKVFHAPFDVCLNPKSLRFGKDDTVVQPDLLVVCDKTNLDGNCMTYIYGDENSMLVPVRVLDGCEIDLHDIFPITEETS